MKPRIHTTRRPARQESLHTHPLAGYLAGAVGSAALLGAPQAEAAVTAVTFGFGSQYTVSDGTANFSVGSFGLLAGYAQGGKLRLGNYSTGQVYNNSSSSPNVGQAQFFANGTILGAGGNGGLGYAFFQNNFYGPQNIPTNQLNQNIGFKTSTNNWGWANVSWDAAVKALTINSAYVESVANTNITVGDVGAVPEPSRALLALAGLGGVALRRRRKQAA